MTSERFHTRATRLAPFPKILFVVPLLSAALATWMVVEGEVSGFYLQVLAFLLGGILFARKPRPRRPVRVSIDGDGALHLGSERFAAPGTVVSLLASGAGPRALVAIERDDGQRVDLELDSPEHVAELQATLRASGLGMSAQVFRGHTPFGLLNSFAIIIGVIWAAGWVALRLAATHPVLVSLLLPSMLTGVPLGIAALRTYSVTLGIEGIWLRRTSSWRAGRLVKHRDVTVREGRVSHMVTLYEGDDRLVALELGNSNEARSLAASLRHRREVENVGGGELLETRLARGERPSEEWLGALQKQADPRDEGYRVARVAPDQLWAILENPAADPTARIGAAVTLRVQDGAAPVRERLRLAAAATALPEVREATEILAEERDEEPPLSRVARALG